MSFQKIQEFIRYNNAVPIMVALVVLGGTGVFAATTVVNQEPVVEAPKIQTQILEEYDLTTLPDEVDIVSINELEEYIEVVYTFTTLSVVDGQWKEIVRQNTLKVRNKDRFTSISEVQEYINQELFEVVAQDRSVLARAQEEILQPEKITGFNFGNLVGALALSEPEVVTSSDGLLAQAKTNNTQDIVVDRITITQGPVALGDGSGNNVTEELIVYEEPVVVTVTEVTDTNSTNDNEVTTTTAATSTTTESSASTTATSIEQVSTSTATTTEVETTDTSTTTEQTATTTPQESDEAQASTTTEAETSSAGEPAATSSEEVIESEEEVEEVVVQEEEMPENSSESSGEATIDEPEPEPEPEPVEEEVSEETTE